MREKKQKYAFCYKSNIFVGIFIEYIFSSVCVISSYLTFHVFRRLCWQANGSAMKAGGNSKDAFLALPASKIPAFIPSSWKRSSGRAARSRLTNQTSSSSSKSSIPCLSLSWPSCRPVSPSQRPEGQSLTLPPQTQNGQSCSYSYSSSSSSVSPTSTSTPYLLSPRHVLGRWSCTHGQLQQPQVSEGQQGSSHYHTSILYWEHGMSCPFVSFAHSVCTHSSGI